MLPLPSNFRLYLFSSSGQFFSALVIFLFLLGGPFAAFGRGGSVFFGGGAVGCGFELAVGSGNTSIVTRGSVVSFLKSSLSTGWSLTGRNEPCLLLCKDRPKLLVCSQDLIQLDGCKARWHILCKRLQQPLHPGPRGRSSQGVCIDPSPARAFAAPIAASILIQRLLTSSLGLGLLGLLIALSAKWMLPV